MILELVEINLKPGTAAAFEAAFSQAIPLLEGAKGCLSARLVHGIENPDRYRLLVHWETLEDHTEGYRGSPNQLKLRDLIAPYADPHRRVPTEHHTIAIEGFAEAGA